MMQLELKTRGRRRQRLSGRLEYRRPARHDRRGPTLVVEGERGKKASGGPVCPVGPAEAALGGYVVVDASEAEKRALWRAGYRLPGLF